MRLLRFNSQGSNWLDVYSTFNFEDQLFSQMLKVRVPASTANIGPGFDTLGCALNLYLNLEFTAEPNYTNQIHVTYTGVGQHDKVPLDRTNLVVQAMLHLLFRKRTGDNASSEQFNYNAVHVPISGKLHIINDIPLSRGLGSSAAAIVGGMFLANEVWNLKCNKDELMDNILELENHPDNVGACLFGSMIVGFVRNATDREYGSNAYSGLRRRCGYQKLTWNPLIKHVCIVPRFELSTAVARNILPKVYSREDLVFNLQRLAVLIPALSSQDDTVLRQDPHMFHDILTDRVHQPYRLQVVPGLQEIIETVTSVTCPGLLGIVLSGAGPSVLALATHNYNAVAERIQFIFSKHGVESDYHLLDVDTDGAVRLE